MTRPPGRVGWAGLVLGRRWAGLSTRNPRTFLASLAHAPAQALVPQALVHRLGNRVRGLPLTPWLVQCQSQMGNGQGKGLESPCRGTQ